MTATRVFIEGTGYVTRTVKNNEATYRGITYKVEKLTGNYYKVVKEAK
jgi:hypothetical protein